MFSSPHGDFSFSIGAEYAATTPLGPVFVPSRGFLFFYKDLKEALKNKEYVFVPSRGFLFFYERRREDEKVYVEFSSPHGDFSFSITQWVVLPSFHGFRPLTGISLFL